MPGCQRHAAIRLHITHALQQRSVYQTMVDLSKAFWVSVFSCIAIRGEICDQLIYAMLEKCVRNNGLCSPARFHQKISVQVLDTFWPFIRKHMLPHDLDFPWLLLKKLRVEVAECHCACMIASFRPCVYQVIEKAAPDVRVVP